MKLHTKQRTTRDGFTLVELMVVILIIAVLIGLIGSALSKARNKANQVRNRSDISQVAAALENFKARFGVYPPSRIKLCEVYPATAAYPSSYGTNPADALLDQDSLLFLQRIFPHLDWTTPQNGGWLGIDWNGNNPAPPATGVPPDPPVILEGEQCLVFFLGGIPDRLSGLAGCIGFSANPRDPSAKTGDRIGPFFDFESSRLGVWPGTGGGFYSYLDTYKGAPYAYFSSYRATNNYNRYFSIYKNSDCPSLPSLPVGGPWPYIEALNPNIGPRYLNSNTFQIISAGGDAVFGPGSSLNLTPVPLWTKQNASTFYPEGVPGRNNQSNFYDSVLGVGE